MALCKACVYSNLPPGVFLCSVWLDGKVVFDADVFVGSIAVAFPCKNVVFSSAILCQLIVVGVRSIPSFVQDT